MQRIAITGFLLFGLVSSACAPATYHRQPDVVVLCCREAPPSPEMRVHHEETIHAVQREQEERQRQGDAVRLEHQHQAANPGPGAPPR